MKRFELVKTNAKKLNLKAVVYDTVTGFKVVVNTPNESCFLSCVDEVNNLYAADYDVEIVDNRTIKLHEKK